MADSSLKECENKGVTKSTFRVHTKEYQNKRLKRFCPHCIGWDRRYLTIRSGNVRSVPTFPVPTFPNRSDTGKPRHHRRISGNVPSVPRFPGFVPSFRPQVSSPGFDKELPESGPSVRVSLSVLMSDEAGKILDVE